MKCHYTYTKDGEKVLIPICWEVVNSGDMSRCTCRSEKTITQFEKEKYNEVVRQLRKEIRELEKENARLNRIIKKQTKNYGKESNWLERVQGGCNGLSPFIRKI